MLDAFVLVVFAVLVIRVTIFLENCCFVKFSFAKTCVVCTRNLELEKMDL